jgi:hypothetical protein
MARPLPLLLLLLTSCTQHRSELEAAEAALEAHLRAQVEVGSTLNERRKLKDAIEAQVRALAEGKPMEPLPKFAPMPPIPTAPSVTLPAEGRFEGSGGAMLRARIAQTQARIKEMDRLLNELAVREQERLELEKKLEELQQPQSRDGGS